MRLARALLYASVAAAGLLALAWPFAVSADGDDPAFRVAAIAVALAFFAALSICCAGRLLGAWRAR